MARIELVLNQRDVYRTVDDRTRDEAVKVVRTVLESGGTFVVNRSPTPDPDGIGARVADARKAKGWTQVDLAAAMNRSESWVSQVERNTRHVDRVSVLDQLAQVLGVSATWLTTIAGGPDDVVVVPAASVYIAKVTK